MKPKNDPRPAAAPTTQQALAPAALTGWPAWPLPLLAGLLPLVGTVVAYSLSVLTRHRRILQSVSRRLHVDQPSGAP